MYWFINCSLLSDGPVIQFLTSISSFSLSNYRKMQTLRKTKVSWHFWKHTTLKARCSFPGTTCSRHTRNTLQQVKMYLPSERQGRFTARIFFPHHSMYFNLKSWIPQVFYLFYVHQVSSSCYRKTQTPLTYFSNLHQDCNSSGYHYSSTHI